MKKGLSKEFVLIAGLATLMATLFLTSDVRAQELECFHDPYPSEAQSTRVPCDDPSCNVGPCTKKELIEVEQLIRDPNDPACNVGPCNNQNTVSEEAIEERVEAKRAALLERLQDRVINLTANVVARLDGAVERFEQIIIRIETRIIKLNDLGVETNEAEAALLSAKNTLSSTKEELENLSSVREAITGDSPREAFAVVRGELRGIHALLQDTHTELRTVVALLKEAVRASGSSQGVSDAVSNENAGDESSENPE